MIAFITTLRIDAHVRSAGDVHSIKVKALTLEIEDLKRTVEQYNLKVEQYRVKDAQSLAALQSMQQEKQVKATLPVPS